MLGYTITPCNITKNYTFRIKNKHESKLMAYIQERSKITVIFPEWKKKLLGHLNVQRTHCKTE
jgi:hypothetical protein